MKRLAITLMLCTPMAHADKVESIAELVRLPAYCRGTQQIRDISGDTVPIKDYERKYGFSYSHLHHYCWALNSENNAAFMNDRYLASGKLEQALGDIDYVLRANDDPKFIFLPEIYTTKARILFKLKKSSDAILWLQKAIDANPRYMPAYARLSDYYLDQGDKSKAVKILEKGIAHGQRTEILTLRLKKLESYSDTPSSKPKFETSAQ